MEHLEPLKPLWIALSFLGDAAFLLFFFSTLFLWAIYKKKPYLEQIYNTIFLLGIGIVVSYLLKVLVGRSRPLYLQDNIGPLFAPFNLNNAFHSFPSSHALSTAIVSFYLIKRKWLKIIFILFVSLSRIALFKHHITDVLAAIVIAYFMVYELDRVYLFSYLKNKIWKGLEKTMGKSLDLPKKF